MRCAVLSCALFLAAPPCVQAADITIMTWNVRGHPEKNDSDAEWFDRQIGRIRPDLLLVQEIANEKAVIALGNREGFAEYAFQESSNGMDNAILSADTVDLLDTSDPAGFQHPAQMAYIDCGGFDAYVVTVHLSWTDVEKRKAEKKSLKKIVDSLPDDDPDLIVAGDFNVKEAEIQALADELGLVVLVPEGQEGAGTTHASNRYDHFLVSRDLADEEAKSARIEVFGDKETASRVSDHLPVIAKFRNDDRFGDWARP